MDTDRYKRLKKIFQDAVERPPGERSAFIDTACEGDKELRKEVMSLLSADTDAGSFLAPPDTSGLSPESWGKRLVGAEIGGKYKLERVISAGGMGTVYEAAQEHPQRNVAVKIMNRAPFSRSAHRRFEYESQILARLEHPGIAQVIEAGTHKEDPDRDDDRGIPYFVMEYIQDAQPISVYAREKNLSVKERLALFTQICDAVHYGHQKGILHRDLKPANLLVNAEGRIKVIDFGVARVMDPDGELTTMHTEVGQLIGTMQYMSPEQFKADPHDLDVRSDVYALGIILYELLCDQLPYDVRKTAFFEAARIIREEPPKRLTTRGTRLRGDMETIVLKTLEKDRTHRYQTVIDLSEDIERFLNGEVIHARPAGPMLRLWKYVRRHPVMSSTVGVALFLITGFVLYIMFVSYPRVLEERDRATQAAEKAEAVSDFLANMLASPDPEREGRNISMLEVLQGATERVDDAFDAQPDVRASLLLTIGYTLSTLGQLEKAEANMRSALEIRRRLFGEKDSKTVDAKHSLANLIGERGQFEEAEKLNREVIDIRRRELGEEHHRTLSTMNNLANLMSSQKKFSEAAALHREVMNICKRTVGEEHDDTVMAMHNLASALKYLNKLDEAEKFERKVLDIRSRKRGDEHPLTLATMNNLAMTMMHQERFDEVRPLLKRVIEGSLKCYGEEHPATMITRSNLAGLHVRQGNFAEAETLFREILEVRKRTLGVAHPKTWNSMHCIANSLADQGKRQEAIAQYRLLIATVSASVPEDHPDLVGYKESLTDLLAEEESADPETNDH